MSYAQAPSAQIVELKTSLVGDDVAVSARVDFDLPPAIESAMLKGVALTFVVDIEVTRDRWYWWNKKIADTNKQIRISYQALTRRWRVQPWSDRPSSGGLGVQIAQTYDGLSEALSVAKNINAWRIAKAQDVEGSKSWLALHYHLDVTQLPKPLQIGLLGQEDWAIDAEVRSRITLQETKP